MFPLLREPQHGSDQREMVVHRFACQPFPGLLAGVAFEIRRAPRAEKVLSKEWQQVPLQYAAVVVGAQLSTSMVARVPVVLELEKTQTNACHFVGVERG